jgi:hypothetical protein
MKNGNRASGQEILIEKRKRRFSISSALPSHTLQISSLHFHIAHTQTQKSTRIYKFCSFSIHAVENMNEKVFYSITNIAELEWLERGENLTIFSYFHRPRSEERKNIQQQPVFPFFGVRSHSRVLLYSCV